MTTTNGTVPPADAAYDPSHDYHALNAMLNLYDAQGRIQFDKDKAAEREYVTGHVAANTIAFPTTRQRLDYLIRNSTDVGDTVYDPFCGSGTTLLACEQANRKCVAVELSPRYCDVILRRWETLTGRRAERLRNLRE